MHMNYFIKKKLIQQKNMNQNKSYYSFNLSNCSNENKSPPHTVYFSKLPQIDAVRSIHEENMRKQKVAYETKRKHYQMYTEEKEKLNIKQKQVEQQLISKMHQSKDKKIRIQKQKSQHLKTVLQTKENIEKRKELQRKRLFQRQKIKLQKVLTKHQSYYQLQKKKKRNNYDVNKIKSFKKDKKRQEIEASEKLLQESILRIKNAEERKSSSFEHSSIICHLHSRLRKSQQYLEQKSKEKEKNGIQRKIIRQQSLGERMRELSNQLRQSIDDKKTRQQDLLRKARDKKKRMEEVKEQKNEKMAEETNNRIFNSSIFREQNSNSKLQRKRRQRQFRQSKIKKQNEEITKKREKISDQIIGKENDSWNFLTNVKQYRDRLIEQSIYQSSTFALKR